jgi:hypothetical protein
MTLRSPTAVPPIVVFEPKMNTPVPLPRAAVPVGSVPMKSPAITSPGDTKTPELPKRLITSPRTVMPETKSVRPFAFAPAPDPSSSMIGVPIGLPSKTC